MKEQIRLAAIGGLAVLMLLLTAAGCGALRLRNPWDIYYDADRYGTTEPNILRHFNLHRGRWWNYYARGTCYLAYGHYQKAQDDFNEAMARRSGDTRDARTYGMHFIDYFPQRESGIALYLQNLAQAHSPAQKGLYGRAISALETSLRQEESARAKFYLNQARREYLRMTIQDVDPPLIWVKRPIRTNRETARFDVTAIDCESCVAEIKISGSPNYLEIARPTYLMELAEKMVTRTVEVTLRPGERCAVVEITASDLVGNWSAPTKALIILDTMSPEAVLSLPGGETLPDGRFLVRVNARDDFGLGRIQVGEDENDALDCEGKFECSATFAALPRNGEIPVAVVDSAGNETVGSIPIGGSGRPLLVADASWPKGVGRFAAVSGGAVWSGNGPALSGLAAEWNVPPSFVSMQTGAGARMSMTHLTQAPPLLTDWMSGTDHPTYYLRPRLRQESGATATTRPAGSGGGDFDPRRVYQILLLLLVDKEGPATPPSLVEPEFRRKVYGVVLESLKDLQLDNGSRTLPARFGVHDVSTEYASRTMEEVWDKPETEVVRYLRDSQATGRDDRSDGASEVERQPVDVVVYGNLRVYKVGREEEFLLTLRALDVLTPNEPLRFPRKNGVGGIDSQVLAETYGPKKDLQHYIDNLASTVSQKFPWLQANMFLASRGWVPFWPRDIRINVGRKHRVFNGMRLYFYYGGDRQHPVRTGRIIDVDQESSSRVSYGSVGELAPSGVIAITK